jgi:hypothetical protein
MKNETKKETETERMAGKHPVRWYGPESAHRFTVLGSLARPQALIEFRGEYTGDMAEIRSELLPEYEAEIQEFKAGKQFQQLETLRQRVRVGDEITAELEKQVAEEKAKFIDGNGVHEDWTYAQDELRRVREGQEELRRAIQLAYEAAAAEFRRRMSNASRAVMEDAKQAQAKGRGALGEAAGKALSVLCMAAHRMDESQRLPNMEAYLGKRDDRRQPQNLGPIELGPGIIPVAGVFVPVNETPREPAQHARLNVTAEPEATGVQVA